MSESREENQEATEAQYKPFGWWRKYAGKPVVVQLRDGLSWIGVTSPNNIVVNEQNVPVSIPFLKGELIMEGSDRDFRVGILGSDPDPDKPNAKLRIFFHPDDAAFVTVVEQGLITS